MIGKMIGDDHGWSSVIIWWINQRSPFPSPTFIWLSFSIINWRHIVEFSFLLISFSLKRFSPRFCSFKITPSLPLPTHCFYLVRTSSKGFCDNKPINQFQELLLWISIKWDDIGSKISKWSAKRPKIIGTNCVDFDAQSHINQSITEL